MRIISGKFKGRRFTPPADNWPTRPTTDYAKEGLFNVLNNWLDFADQRVLDLFGGTGSHGYEFISRGCTDVTYVDQHPPAVAFVEKTVKALGIAEQFKVFRMDVFRFLQRPVATPYTYIFAGPPYPLPNIPELPDLVFEAGLLAPGGLFVMETNPHHDFSSDPRCTDKRSYGKTIFWFFEHVGGEEE
ncbi:RsmD family RNA methyltransferase [Neolewinella lacunae]|uniref:RsmD family RNA methyltransferase n=1 Tax=Neolewinella lacunae TaxID=1517758 RepID=A0A923TDW7_9BACT|nr:RsmD family RNA methyltransferase [Neolewinella lacunae]MBC6995277.1 RsmD family RNA methyltransferase [Neolewinella lacunae]MDN3635553.1 RsmD family RNA methyltransferase [Neolewinella lacunae]